MLIGSTTWFPVLEQGNKRIVILESLLWIGLHSWFSFSLLFFFLSFFFQRGMLSESARQERGKTLPSLSLELIYITQAVYILCMGFGGVPSST